MLDNYVSVIVPCYNREKILWRFLESVLSQTYKKLQIIMIDDGSTDKTLEIIKKYKKQFDDEQIIYEYYSKHNGGVSSAINEGLKYVKGEFLCWPDSDDWYEPDAMEKRVRFLKENPKYAIVSCDAVCSYEAEKSSVLQFVSGKTKDRWNENQFWLMLKGKTLVCPICHMVRTEAFWYSHPDRKIYGSRHGQNIQMLLPVYYFFKRGFIDEALCHYLVLEGSLSRSDDTFQKKLSYREAIEKLTIETLKSIQMPRREQKKCFKYTKVKNTRRKLILAKNFKDKEFAKKQIKKLIELKSVSFKDVIVYLTI